MNCVSWNLGEPRCFDKAVERAEEATIQCVILVVGLTRIRGVNRVMPIECIKHTRRG